MRLGEVLQHSGEFHGVWFFTGIFASGIWSDAQGTEIDGVAGQVQRGLHEANGRFLFGALQAQIRGAGFDAVGSGSLSEGGT